MRISSLFRKKLIIGSLALCLIGAVGISGNKQSSEAATSAGWHQNSVGWWYSYSDGSYAVNTWLKNGGKWYHFDSKGYMQTGWLEDQNSWYYLSPESGAMVTGWRTINGKWYLFKPSGQMACNEWYNGYWLNPNGVWSYKHKGSWHKNSKGWWFSDTSGWYAKGLVHIDNKYYYFNIDDGYLYTNRWINSTCFGPDGAMISNASTDWAKAYLEYLYKSDYLDDPNSYDATLFYLDNDSTPELLVQSAFAFNDGEILTYHNGKISKSTVQGGIGYIEYSGKMLSICGSSGCLNYDLTELKNGVFKNIGSGYTDEHIYDYKSGKLYCYWNDVEVDSQEKFEALIQKQYNMKKQQYTFDNWLTLDAVEYFLWSCCQ